MPVVPNIVSHPSPVLASVFEPSLPPLTADGLMGALLRSEDWHQIELVAEEKLPTWLGARTARLFRSEISANSANDMQFPLPASISPELTTGDRAWSIENLGGLLEIAVPVQVEGATIAILWCEFSVSTELTQDVRLHRLQQAAQLFASRLSGTRLVESLRNSVARLAQAERLQRALYVIADQASTDRDMSEVLHALHGIVSSLMYAENFYIVLYDRENGKVRFPYFVDVLDLDPPAPDQDTPFDELRGSLTWHLLQNGTALRGSPEALEQKVAIPLRKIGPDCVDWLGVPMIRAHEAVGAIVVQSYAEATRFSAEDQALLTYVAQHILTALDRKQAHEQLEKRVSERTDALSDANRVLQEQVVERQRGEHLQAALFRIAELANTTESLEQFYVAVHRIVGSLLQARNFYIALLSDDQTELSFPYAIDELDPDWGPRKLGNGLTEYVLHSGKALLADHTKLDELRANGEAIPIGVIASCWLGVPLICSDRTVGVLTVQSYSDENPYTIRDQELLTFVSYHIANALERKRNAESLKRAYAELEQRVGERTTELATANRELRGEIARRERIEHQLKHEALHDALTGLPNRTFLLDRLQQVITNYHHDRRRLFAVLFLDLDRFKIVNDSVGHLIGDELLEEVGRRIADCLEPHDMAARLGGDEFAVVLTDIENADDASAYAERLIETLNAPIRLGAKEVFTSASVGIALAAPHYRKAEELLRDADAALYRAKDEGRHRFAIFDERLRQDALDLLELESDLRRAVSRHEFESYFQPIVQLDSAKFVGYEALLRWRHPHRGLLKPAEFLELAEDGGLAEQIDWQIFDGVCAIAPALISQGCYVSINLSGRHFRSPTLDRNLLQLFAKHNVDPHSIRVEVTERVLLNNPPQVKSILEALRTAGVTVALDDFGTGYSSLSYLHQFPLQVLKIDRSFVIDLSSTQDSGNSAVVRAILALAGALNMQAVAEGIETEEQREALLKLGCTLGQGYLFGSPKPAAIWLAHNPASERKRSIALDQAL